MREHATRVFIKPDHFAESVTFHAMAGPELVNCNVKVDDGIRDSEGDNQTIFTGVVFFPAVSDSVLGLNDSPVLLLTVFGEVWDVIDVGPDELGVRKIGIRRTRAETKHSNAFTINQIQNLYR